VPAVLAQALDDALAPLGVHVTAMPLNPSRLYQMITEARRSR
jgi:hypothetical protein